MARKKNEDVFQQFLKETCDALESHDGSCISKMIGAFEKYGFNVQRTTHEDGTSSAYVNGDEGIPSAFFSDEEEDED